MTVLADGAKWIWEEQLNHLRGAEGVWSFPMRWNTSPRRLVASTETSGMRTGTLSQPKDRIPQLHPGIATKSQGGLTDFRLLINFTIHDRMIRASRWWRSDR